MIIKYTEEEFKKADGKDLLKLICKNCQEIFYKRKSKIEHELIYNENKWLFCGKNCFYNGRKNRRKDSTEVTEKRFNKFNNMLLNTENWLINKTNGKIPTDIKQAAYDIALKKRIGKLYIKKCLECNNFFINKNDKTNCCSNLCGSTYWLKNNKEFVVECGRKSANSQNNRSKNEIYFAELCQQKFENVLTNHPIFNGWDADVILPDLKIAIMWNGVWHYKKISEKHSLEQVQSRDKIKIKEIEKMNYIPYIIKDMGDFNKKFVEQQFETLLEYIKTI